MRLPRPRFSLRSSLVLVALIGSLLGVDRLWRRSDYYRKQAAFCAFLELQNAGYHAYATDKDHLKETARRTLIDMQRYRSLKNIYHGLVWRPWESLPPDTPYAV